MDLTYLVKDVEGATARAYFFAGFPGMPVLWLLNVLEYGAGSVEERVRRYGSRGARELPPDVVWYVKASKHCGSVFLLLLAAWTVLRATGTLRPTMMEC